MTTSPSKQQCDVVVTANKTTVLFQFFTSEAKNWVCIHRSKWDVDTGLGYIYFTVNKDLAKDILQSLMNHKLTIKGKL
jgi:hypothetical protein